MADVAEQRAAVQEARDKNGEAEARFKGMADDTQAALDVLGDLPNTLSATLDVLDTQLQNATAATVLSAEAREAVELADENLDFTEARNAHQLLEHMSETGNSISAVVNEAKEALEIAKVRLTEVVESLKRAHGGSDEALISSGSAEENLAQLAERLGG